MHSIGQAISDEVRGKHSDTNKQGKYNYPYGLICWAPVLNICRDRKQRRLDRVKRSNNYDHVRYL